MGISALRNIPYKAFISRKNDEKQNWIFSARLKSVRDDTARKIAGVFWPIKTFKL